MYRFENEEKEMLDPALVLTGTKCGSHHVGTVPACNGLGHFMVSLSHVESDDYQGTHLLSNVFPGDFYVCQKLIS